MSLTLAIENLKRKCPDAFEVQEFKKRKYTVEDILGDTFSAREALAKKVEETENELRDARVRIYNELSEFNTESSAALEHAKKDIVIEMSTFDRLLK